MLPILVILGAGAYVASSKKSKGKAKGKASPPRCHAPMLDPSRTVDLLPPGVTLLSKQDTIKFAKLLAPQSRTPIRAMKALHNCNLCDKLAKGVETYDEMVASGQGLMREDDLVTDEIRQLMSLLALMMAQDEAMGQSAADQIAHIQGAMQMCGIK